MLEKSKISLIFKNFVFRPDSIIFKNKWSEKIKIAISFDKTLKYRKYLCNLKLEKGPFFFKKIVESFNLDRKVSDYYAVRKSHNLDTLIRFIIN